VSHLVNKGVDENVIH